MLIASDLRRGPNARLFSALAHGKGILETRTHGTRTQETGTHEARTYQARTYQARAHGAATQEKRILIPYPSIVYMDNNPLTWPVSRNSTAKSASRTVRCKSSNRQGPLVTYLVPASEFQVCPRPGTTWLLPHPPTPQQSHSNHTQTHPGGPAGKTSCETVKPASLYKSAA